jgi:hypothetical protein
VRASASLLALKFAALKNLAAALASSPHAADAQAALAAYTSAAAIDGTDVVLWRVSASLTSQHSL